MRNNSIKVSVVVSVYNGEAYLRQCLDSLICQTLKDLEVIVVNDASTDGTQDIVAEYECLYPNRITGITLKENLKQGGARNVGFRHATGEYLSYCDADDWVDPQMYEKLYVLAKQGDYDRTCCYYCKHHKDNRVEMKFAPRGWTSLLRTSIVQRHALYFPEKTAYEDIFFVKVIGYYMKSTAILPEHLYHYRVHKNSTTHSLSSDVMKQRVSIEIEILNELERRNLEHSPFSAVTNAEFLSRGILKNCQAWFVKVGEIPDKEQRVRLRETLKCRLPMYQQALPFFSVGDRLRLLLFIFAPSIFIAVAWLQLKVGKERPWGEIGLGFCANRN